MVQPLCRATLRATRVYKKKINIVKPADSYGAQSPHDMIFSELPLVVRETASLKSLIPQTLRVQALTEGESSSGRLAPLDGRFFEFERVVMGSAHNRLLACNHWQGHCLW